MERQQLSKLENPEKMIAGFDTKRIVANLLAGPLLTISAGTAAHYGLNKLIRGPSANSGNSLVDLLIDVGVAFVSNVPYLLNETIAGLTFSAASLVEYRIRRNRKIYERQMAEKRNNNPFAYDPRRDFKKSTIYIVLKPNTQAEHQ